FPPRQPPQKAAPPTAPGRPRAETKAPKPHPPAPPPPPPPPPRPAPRPPRARPPPPPPPPRPAPAAAARPGAAPRPPPPPPRQRPRAEPQQRHRAHQQADQQAVDQRHAQFLPQQDRGIARADLAEGEAAHHQGQHLDGGVAADAGDDRHQHGEGHDLLDGRVELADHRRRQERGEQVDAEPDHAAAHRAPDRREQVLVLVQAGRAQGLVLGLLAD